MYFTLQVQGAYVVVFLLTRRSRCCSVWYSPGKVVVFLLIRCSVLVSVTHTLNMLVFCFYSPGGTCIIVFTQLEKLMLWFLLTRGDMGAWL